jgi:hypothetical protein
MLPSVLFSFTILKHCFNFRGFVQYTLAQCFNRIAKVGYRLFEVLFKTLVDLLLSIDHMKSRAHS